MADASEVDACSDGALSVVMDDNESETSSLCLATDCGVEEDVASPGMVSSSSSNVMSLAIGDCLPLDEDMAGFDAEGDHN